MLTEELARAIKTFFRGEVHTEAATLDTYSRDASLFKVRPALVLFPRDAIDIARLVEFVKREKPLHPELSITVRAAGTCMSGGSLNESIILDVTKFMHGVSRVSDESATALPGTFYRDFEQETLKHGRIMPSYPASRELCALGGLVGNNAGGEKTLAYGKTEDYIESLKIIFSDGHEYLVKPLDRAALETKMAQSDFEGDLYRQLFKLITEHETELAAAKPKVTKNSAGYYLWNVWDGQTFNLAKLIVGSQGTLGIVTEITFRLVPIKPISKLLVVFLKDLTPVARLVNELLPLKPESIESYDDNTIKLALRFWRGIMKSMKAKRFFRLLASFLPEVSFLIRGGLPKLVVLAEFSGDNETAINDALIESAKRAAKLGLQHRVTKTPEEASKYWTIRRESFNLLRHHVKGKRTAPFIDDIIVRPEFLPEFLPKLTAILDRYHLWYTIAGHVGDGNFHIIPLMGPEELRDTKVITEISSLVYDLVVSYGGSITAEHNDGIVRTPYLEKLYGPEICELFRQTKTIFDPQNIFNPGKKVGGTIKYLTDHLSPTV
ncbi:MAG: FAD-binding oxidoreductase [Patescibacteria group bacterium]